MDVKTAAAKTGYGIWKTLEFVAIATNDSPRKKRIREIDETIEALQEERARLESELWNSPEN